MNVIDNAVSLEERRSTENNEEEEEEIEESSGRGEEMGGTESI